MTGAFAIRSRTARTAGRASRSCGTSRTTGRTRRWRASRCARRASRSTAIRPTAASTPSPTPARSAARGCASATRAAMRRRSRSPRRGGGRGACAARRGRPGHQGRSASISRAVPTTSGGGQLRAQAPRGQAIRVDGPTWPARAGSSSSGQPRRTCSPDERDRSCSPGDAPAAHVAAAVAPGAPELGVMLPYSPLHHLLLSDAGAPLVMTSGNVSDEPIAYRTRTPPSGSPRSPTCSCATTADRDTHGRLGGARGSRPSARPQALARSRAWRAGLPVDCGHQLLACGAELKNTFALAKGGAPGWATTSAISRTTRR